MLTLSSLTPKAKAKAKAKAMDVQGGESPTPSAGVWQGTRRGVGRGRGPRRTRVFAHAQETREEGTRREKKAREERRATRETWAGSLKWST